MIAAIIITILITLVLTIALCKAAGKEDRWQEKHQFDLYKYCDDDCYMCDYQNNCIRSAMKYNQTL